MFILFLVPFSARASWINNLLCGPLLSLTLGFSPPSHLSGALNSGATLVPPVRNAINVLNPKDSWNFADNPGIVAASVAIFRNSKGQFLMAKRKGSTGDGTFAAVGGKVDQYLTDYGAPLGYGDDFYAAAIREAHEEVGVGLEKQDLKFITSVQYIHPENKKTYVVAVFEVLEWRGEPSIQEPEKMTDLDWYDIEDLRHNLYPASMVYLKAVENYFKLKDETQRVLEMISTLGRYN